VKERILNWLGWKHFRAWRHANGDHRLCREIEVRVPVSSTGQSTATSTVLVAYRTEKRHA
jgi:hypothetical protein